MAIQIFSLIVNSPFSVVDVVDENFSFVFYEYYCFHRLLFLFSSDDSAAVMTMVAIAPIIVIQSLSFIVNSPFSVVDVVDENFSFVFYEYYCFTGC